MKKIISIVIVVAMMMAFSSVALAASWSSTTMASKFISSESLPPTVPAGGRITVQFTRNTNTTTGGSANTRVYGCNSGGSQLSSIFEVTGIGSALPYFASKPTVNIHLQLMNMNGGAAPSGNTSSAGTFN